MMSIRWLLPDGVEEILPRQALKVEALRRQVLDLYRTWGYELVIPPLLEFSESLLIGLGQDMQTQTLQFGDPMSARLLALRADITPQIARIDAHRLACQDGDPVNRLCYAGTVVRSRLLPGMHSRTPIFAGAELYGDASLEADCEVILLMLQTLSRAGLQNIHLDLGHVGIYRQLIDAAGIHEAAHQNLFDAIQRKAQKEIDQCLQQLDIDSDLRACLSQLAGLHGDISVLDEARRVLAKAPASVLQLIDDLESLAQRTLQRCGTAIELYFDLSELSAYHYHSGLVFAALVPGMSQPVAKGGRYDEVGEAFGRARPATGFDIELKTLAACVDDAAADAAPVYALENDEAAFWEAVTQLREAQQIVICTRDAAVFAQAARRLEKRDGRWQLLD